MARMLTAIVLLLVSAAPASATRVTYTPPPPEPPGTRPEESCSRYAQCPPASISVTAAPGEANVIDVTREPGGIVIRDAGASLTGDSECETLGDGAVRCPEAAVSVTAGDGNDRVTTSLVGLVDGGPGDDTLTGGTTIIPGPGADTLIGGPEASTVHEDATDLSADRLEGGDGADTLTFAGRGGAVHARVGGLSQFAGSAGEENVVTGFDAIVGGDGGDDLVVDRGALPVLVLGPLLVGNAGADRLVLTGASSPGSFNLVEGRDGADMLRGAEGRDSLTGGAGPDVLDGGPRGDRLFGNGGNDRLRTRDEVRDAAYCGRGRDRLIRDRLDRARNCER